MAYNDYRDIIRQMEREMQQVSDEMFRGFFAIPAGGAGRFWQPPIDIHETEDAVLVKVELAGVKADDLQVSLSPDDRLLQISGSRSESARDREGRSRCHQMEIYFGPFERAVGLPSGLRLDRDAIKATYKEGFLLVTLPKKRSAETAGPQIIPISTEDTIRENEDNS